MRTQYTVAGQSIPTITISYGSFLILWGIVISQISESNSITSYFPSLLGAPLLLSGILANAIPEKRKLWMHIAATFGLLSALGGTRFFMVISDGFNYASSSMLMLLVTGAIYTYICVQSFIWFRKNKEEIEAKISALSEASAGLAQKMYAEQAEAGQQEAEAGGSNEDNDAVEAEFEEVKEDEKKG